MSCTAPLIYAPQSPVARLSPTGRAASAGVAAGCAAVLILAAFLPPSHGGVGTHTRLGLARCEFLYRTGIPCPSCGMTTSFSLLAHGHLLASFYVQPMGCVLALLSIAALWVSLYMAITGKPAHRLLRLLPPQYYFLPLMLLAVAAWGWKIYIHVHGMDGW